MTKKKGITVGELLAKLEADPAWVAAHDQREQERLKLQAEYRVAEAPLVDELRAAGFQVQSAWDLVNTPGTYPRAIPILLAHLPRPYPAAVREGIARALAVPDTKGPGWNLLMRLYLDETEDRVRDGLAVAIAGAADDDVINDVIALARDRRLGSSRLFFLRTLKRSREPRARTTLLELRTDPDLTKEIAVILHPRKRTRKGPTEH